MGALVAVAQKVNWNSIFSSATMRDVLLNGRSDLVEEIKSPFTKKLVQFALKEIFGKESLEIPNIYNWGDDLKTPILNGIHDLIDTTLPSASDLFRILMVQGVFDKQAKESKTDQFLNAAAAGYTHLRANTPLMVNTIDADGAKAGVLGFPAYRNWTTLDMHFTSRKLALSLDEGYELDWNTVAPLVVEAVIYVIYKDNLASLGTMLLDVIDQNGLLKKMNFSVEGVTAHTTVSFNEATF